MAATRHLRPGDRVLVIENYHRAIRRNLPGVRTVEIRFVEPVPSDGSRKAQTRLTFTDGMERNYLASSDWIVV